MPVNDRHSGELKGDTEDLLATFGESSGRDIF